MSLSKDLSDTFNEKMQQTHDAKELDGQSHISNLVFFDSLLLTTR